MIWCYVAFVTSGWCATSRDLYWQTKKDPQGLKSCQLTKCLTAPPTPPTPPHTHTPRPLFTKHMTNAAKSWTRGKLPLKCVFEEKKKESFNGTTKDLARVNDTFRVCVQRKNDSELRSFNRALSYRHTAWLSLSNCERLMFAEKCSFLLLA